MLFVAGLDKNAAGNSDFIVRAYDAKSGTLLWEEPVDTADGIVVFYMMYAPHNDSLVIGSSDTSYHLYVHPADAEAAKLRSGTVVRVSSRVGAIEVPIEIT